MKKKVLALSLSFLLIVSVFATVFAGTVSAAGSSFNNAQTISTNKWYSDYLEYSNDYPNGWGRNEDDYFTFTIPKNGVISLSHYHAKAYEDSSFSWTVQLYDNNWEKMYYMEFSNGKPNTETTDKIGLPKGKYYVKVSGKTEDPYKIKINYSASNLWEKERNDTFNSANALSFYNTYFGAYLSCDYEGDRDFFKVSVPANGYMNLTFGHKVACSDYSDSAYEVSVYNPNWQLINEWDFTDGKPLSEITSKFKVKKGTYYIKVTPKYCDNTYTLRLNYYFTLTQPKISKITMSPTVARVYWNKISGASGYQIYRSTSKNGTYKLVKTVSGGSVTNWKNIGLTPNKTYYYKIRAYKTIGGKKYYSSFSAARGKKLRIYKAKIASAKNASGKKMTVKWYKTSYATGYQLRYYYTTSSKKTVTVKGIKSLSKTVKSLKKGKTYKVYVRAYKVFNGKTYYGPWSTVKKVKITK